MTREEVRKIAAGVLQRTKSALAKNGNVDPCVLFATEAGHLETARLPGEAMNSGHAKDLLFGFLAAYARQRNDLAVVILVTDGWTLVFSEEQKRRLKDPDEKAVYDALARDYTGGLPACAAAGFGELWEALILSVQTPLFAILMKQHYRRAGADKRHILFAEFEELEDLEGALGGRLFDIWDRQAAGAPRQ
jgi:hypothetical protein